MSFAYNSLTGYTRTTIT